MIRCIVFDWDGVFTRNFYDGILSVVDDRNRLVELEWRYSDTMDSAGFWEDLRRELAPERSKRELVALFNREEMTGLLDRLPEFEGYTLVLLSNQVTERTDYIRRTFDLSRFDHVFFSNEVGLKKPNEDIYRYVLEKIGMRAEECVFVDDTPENVEAAKRVGMEGILFRSKGQMREEMRAMGVRGSGGNITWR